MKIGVLVAEIGSTTTVVNAFDGIGTINPVFVGQGQGPTTVQEGNVNLGLNQAINDLKNNIKVDSLEYEKLFATSSAAGGLRMTVHGLVYDMTAKAAKEAALGAGANIHLITAGKLRKTETNKIKDINPNIILIAGGIDYGERDTALYNAKIIAELDMKVPVVYAGNVENQEEIKLIFEENGKENLLFLVDNVYPKIDMLNVEPTRKVIQDVFEEHIVHAPGMENIRDLVEGHIIPTPGAVMEASKLLKSELGDLITVDVGGATTDIHSVTEGSNEIARILLAPEPVAKRTVEGDLGVYINAENIINMIGFEKLSKELGESEETMKELMSSYLPIPKDDRQIKFVERLTKEAVIISAHRHAGGYRDLYGGLGKKTFAEGKDLTGVKYIIGTGGACTRLPKRSEILKSIPSSNLKGDKLLPTKEVRILIDNDYIMASLGVLALDYPKDALFLLKQSLKI